MSLPDKTQAIVDLIMVAVLFALLIGVQLLCF